MGQDRRMGQIIWKFPNENQLEQLFLFPLLHLLLLLPIAVAATPWKTHLDKCFRSAHQDLPAVVLHPEVFLEGS